MKKMNTSRAPFGMSLFLFTMLYGFTTTSIAQPNERQLQLFANNCLQCHADPHSGAPQMGDPDHWEYVIAQGEELTLKHVVEGIRGMPPLGYCSACGEQDLRELIYLVTGMTDAEKSNQQNSSVEMGSEGSL